MYPCGMRLFLHFVIDLFSLFPNMQKKYILFIITAIIFIVLKLSFRLMDNDDLQFLLYPTNRIIEIVSGSKGIYAMETGYWHSGLNMLIDKSCSGFNFFLISFLMFVYTFSRINDLKFYWIIPIAVVSAYLLTICANVSRILIYLVLMKQNIPARMDTENIWLHRAEGILVYVSLLIISFVVINRIIIKHNERFTKS